MKTFLKTLNIKESIDEITIYSATLSFYTIFSLVPILLIILSIFSSTPFFAEFYSKIENFIASNILPNHQEVLTNYIKNFLQNSSKMGIVGAIYILITSILFFDNYETIISKIYNQQKRNLWEKIKLYWTMLTLFPLIFSIAMYFSIKFEFFLASSGIKFIIPFLLIWGVFFLGYQLTLTNNPTKITLIVSFLTSLAFIIAKNIFIYYTIINKTYSTIYGSISLLIFLFLWIYISWIIYITGIYLIKWLESWYNFNKKE